MKRYLVTGGTGAIGSALVPLLLANPDNEIYLLTRARDDSELRRRLDELFEYWCVGELEAEYRSRLFAVRGDATLSALGLEWQVFDQLASTVHRIIHAAGAVRMNLPLGEARRSAVGSAREVIALARKAGAAGTLEKVEIISTVGVGGRLPVVQETWMDEPRSFHNSYEQAKADAELLVREAISSGLPITVHRPSMVVGSSLDGRIIHFQVFYHLCEFLAGMRTGGLFPPLGSSSLDIVPVDYVAGAIAWSSAQSSTSGRVIHECAGSGGGVPLLELRRAVVRIFRAHGRRAAPQITLPKRLFGLALKMVQGLVDERTKRAIATLPVFLDYLETGHVFVNDKSATLLADGAGLVCPPWSGYLDRLIACYVDSQRHT